MISPTENHEVHIRDYFYILRKRRFVLLGFLAAALIVGIVFSLFEKVLYRANSTILIEKENPNVVDFKEVISMDTASTDYYQTQYKMLESRTLIHSLIELENLEKDPYLSALRKGRFRKLLRNFFSFDDKFSEFLQPPPSEEIFINKMLRIKPLRNSRLVEINVLHPDPQKAALLTNRLVSLFIEKNLQSRFDVARQATEMISNQLSDLKDRVVASERKLQGYKEAHDLVNIPSIREKNAFLEDAKLELVKIQSEEARLAQRYLPAHPKRIHIRSQIEGLQNKIQEEEAKILAIGGVAVDYAELEREADSARQIYESLLQRLQETASQAKTQASNIVVVDEAQVPTRPYTPRPLTNMMMAFLIGLLGGVLLSFFYEYLDSTVKIPDDIERGLGLDLLGIIPKAERRMKTKQASAADEAFRALRTALLFRLRHVSGCKKMLITSPNPQEGKTTVSLNLAAAFQQNRLKVLLIDADLRRPQLHKVFDIPQEMGLSDILENGAAFEDVVHKNISGLGGIDFLSCGTRSLRPTEILGSQEMSLLITQLTKNYDIIMIDSPPFLAVADVAVLSEYVDAELVIARYHKTDRRHLRDVKRRLNLMTSQKVMGVVINGVSVREKDYYYHQYYYYGYGDAAPGA